MNWSHRVPKVRTTQCDECDHIWGIDSSDDENLDYYYCPRCGLELRKEQMYPDLYPEHLAAPETEGGESDNG